MGVKDGKLQVSALRLLSSDSSMSPSGCHVDENHPISGMLGGSNCTAVRGNEGYSASVKGECGFRRCNRRLSSTTLFNSPEVALANELSPEVELLSLVLCGVGFRSARLPRNGMSNASTSEICNGGVVSRASVE